MTTGSGTRVYVLGDNWLPGVGGLENHTAALTDRLSATVPVEILTSESNTEDHGNPAVPVRRFPVAGDAGYYEGVRDHLLAARGQGPFVLHVMGFSYFWPEAQARLVQEVAHRTGCPVVLKVPTSGHAQRYLTAEFSAARASISAFICLNSGTYREIRDGECQRTGSSPCPTVWTHDVSASATGRPARPHGRATAWAPTRPWPCSSGG